MEEKWPILKPALLTMQAPKFGETNLMTIKAIFGHLDAFYMRWLV